MAMPPLFTMKNLISLVLSYYKYGLIPGRLKAGCSQDWLPHSVLLAACLMPLTLLASERIEAARKGVQANPSSSQAYNELASALSRRGRDSGDPAVYRQADEAIQKSLQLAPDNFDAKKLRVLVLLGENEFVKARELAIALNKKIPDDISIWAVLVDIHAALGDYAEAEHCAQWVLDLRPGGMLGFLKSAQLREVFGDPEGAAEFYENALRRTSQNDLEERAWLLTLEARANLSSSNLKRAAELLEQVQKTYPDSVLALEVLAKLRAQQGNLVEAAALLEKRYAAVSSAANLYDYALALDQAGRKEDARAAFAQFEVKARANTAMPANANDRLVLFYTDRKNATADGLALANREIAARHDLATLDAFAWALYRNGKAAEAKTQMDRALAVGTREPAYFCHASKIAEANHDDASAKKFRAGCEVRTESAQGISR